MSVSSCKKVLFLTVIPAQGMGITVNFLIAGYCITTHSLTLLTLN